MESAIAADADAPERVHPLDAEADEPESIHPHEAEDAEAHLCQLQSYIIDRIVAPLCESSASTCEEDPALRELPSVVQELTGLLQKTWRLAHLRGQQGLQLRRSLVAAKADARIQAERAARAEADRAAAEADAHEQVETTAAKLEALRETLRKRQAEVAEARHRADQLEHSSAAQAERIRQLEARARGEAERRAADAEHSITAAAAGQGGGGSAEQQQDESAAALAEEVDLHRQQGQELRQRLSAVELELGAAREELSAAELRSRELRAQSERRVVELETQVAESQQLAKEAEHLFKAQLQAAHTASTPGSSAGPNSAKSSAVNSGPAVSSDDSRARRSRGSLPQHPTYGTLSDELQAHHRSRRHTVTAVHSGRSPRGVAANNGKAAANNGKAAKAPLPADLRSLGRLLAGGILRG